MSNITTGLDLRNNAVFYPFGDTEQDVAVKSESPVGLEARLAQRGLIVGLEMEATYLKITLLGTLGQKSSLLFKEFVASALSRGYNNVKLDLANLKAVDGVGLAALVWVRNQLEQSNGQIIVSNLSRSVRATLLAANLHYLVEISDYDYR